MGVKLCWCFRFSLWHGLSVICKVLTVVLSVITLQFGLRKTEHGDNDDDGTEVPFYYSPLYRYACSVDGILDFGSQCIIIRGACGVCMHPRIAANNSKQYVF